MPSKIQLVSELAGDHPGFDLARDGAAELAVEALRTAENRHFWYLTRNRFILERLRRLGLRSGARVIELGCGSGCVAAALARAGFDVTAVDGHRALLEVAALRPEPMTLWLHDLARGVEALPERSFEAACLFDVIEHLDAPASALREALRCVRPGGLLVGTVPALMWLWSGIDERAGHKVRYTTRTLSALLRGVEGAAPVEVVPFNRALVPLIWLQRRVVGRAADTAHAVQNLAVPAWPVNAALGGLVMLEQGLSPLLDRSGLQGSSLWFALRRDA